MKSLEVSLYILKTFFLLAVPGRSGFCVHVVTLVFCVLQLELQEMEREMSNCLRDGKGNECHTMLMENTFNLNVLNEKQK